MANWLSVGVLLLAASSAFADDDIEPVPGTPEWREYEEAFHARIEKRAREELENKRAAGVLSETPVNCDAEEDQARYLRTHTGMGIPRERIEAAEVAVVECRLRLPVKEDKRTAIALRALSDPRRTQVMLSVVLWENQRQLASLGGENRKRNRFTRNTGLYLSDAASVGTAYLTTKIAIGIIKERLRSLGGPMKGGLVAVAVHCEGIDNEAEDIRCVTIRELLQRIQNLSAEIDNEASARYDETHR